MHKNKNGKVMFKDIIKACTFKDIKEALLRLYPDQKKVITGYKYVFLTLKHMRPRYNKEGMVIDIRKVGRGKNAYFCVIGVCTEKGTQQSYALEYSPWSKWLGYEVDKKSSQKNAKGRNCNALPLGNDLYGFYSEQYQKQSVKLISKQRVASKTIKHYDSPKTPYQRIMESPYIANAVTHSLAELFKTLNPFDLRKVIEDKLKKIFKTCYKISP